MTAGAFRDSLLNKIALKILEGEKIKADLSVVFVGNKKMRCLNKQYRGQDKATDVLSFAERDRISRTAKFIRPKQAREYLGEVVICPSQTKEIFFCLIHGILHLLGYDHEKGGRKAKEMERRQSHYKEILLNKL
ncbi:MAG: rRNA maturation RNase YbeY [Patescibacteria group bacterium]